MGTDQDGRAPHRATPRFQAEQLGAYLADRPHGPDALVFGMPQGGPLRASTWGERYFRPAVRAAGLSEDPSPP
jgi:hypothetical protein